MLGRRDCLRLGIGAAAWAGSPRLLAGDIARVPLGLDAHSVRGMRWKAPKLVEYAAEIQADALLLNNPHYFESLDEAYLQTLKRSADDKGLRLYSGAGSISEHSVGYKAKNGSPAEVLERGIRIAEILGSPVVTCRIGSIKDRYTEGGIEARMAESIRVLRAARTRAEDANIKFAFENHAADLRTEEVLTIIHEVGPDRCGSMLDPGNALWAMEDPMVQLQKLAPHVLCTSVRDYMVWASDGGATFQWTAIGEGLMDAPKFARTLAEHCPDVPMFVETISNSQRPLPFRTKEHMAGYPNLTEEELVDFLALVKRGRPLEVASPRDGEGKKEFEQRHQKQELLRSFDYLRAHCGVGLTA